MSILGGVSPPLPVHDVDRGWPVSGCFGMLWPEATGWKSIGVLYGGNLDWSDHSGRGTPHNAHLTFLTPLTVEATPSTWRSILYSCLFHHKRGGYSVGDLAPLLSAVTVRTKDGSLGFRQGPGTWDNQAGPLGNWVGGAPAEVNNPKHSRWRTQSRMFRP